MKLRLIGTIVFLVALTTLPLASGCGEKAEETSATETQSKLTKPVDAAEGTVQTIQPINPKQKKP